MMITKEQERRALAKILAIIESLGEDSYVGTAFEGCAEIARQNIDNDFACSMRQRVYIQEARADRLALELQRMTEACQTANAKKQELIEKLHDARETIAQMAERERKLLDILNS